MSATLQSARPTTTVRLTRRGRLAVLLLALVVLLAAGLLLAQASMADGEDTPDPTRVVVVAPGETLWGLAQETVAATGLSEAATDDAASPDQATTTTAAGAVDPASSGASSGAVSGASPGSSSGSSSGADTPDAGAGQVAPTPGVDTTAAAPVAGACCRACGAHRRSGFRQDIYRSYGDDPL